MEKKSCGAILYTFNSSGELGVILGDERRGDMLGWLPFKGGCREGETIEETAIREVYEETCGLVKKESIDLPHKFSTKRKEYHIGLCDVPYSIIEEFDAARTKEVREEFMEKQKLKFFKFPDVLRDPTVHSISKASILYYKDFLEQILSFKKLNYIKIENSRYLGAYQIDTEISRPVVCRKKKRKSRSLFKMLPHTPSQEQNLDWRKSCV